ncbi:MAG TPA: alpha-aminoadipate/glutamate carrier protein LysW/ArgW [Nitrososphaerales archaeon]|nr:alpha-aminoadipate/glutamate carrier protein LysW/ArgW [Nitrososphaerales archaeon]
MATNCPECLAEISVPNDAIDGEIVTCNECGSAFELEISQSSSGVVTLKPAESVGEDWGE